MRYNTAAGGMFSSISICFPSCWVLTEAHCAQQLKHPTSLSLSLPNSPVTISWDSSEGLCCLPSTSVSNNRGKCPLRRIQWKQTTTQTTRGIINRAAEDFGLAGLRKIAVRLAGGGNRRKKGRKRPIKVKDKLMDWWHKVVFPVRRLWFVVSTRVKSHREKGAGLLKLHDDVQTCGYEDVQVMWEMLRRSEMESTGPSHGKRKLRPFWRVFIWSNHNASPSSSGNHA